MANQKKCAGWARAGGAQMGANQAAECGDRQVVVEPLASVVLQVCRCNGEGGGEGVIHLEIGQ